MIYNPIGLAAEATGVSSALQTAIQAAQHTAERAAIRYVAAHPTDGKFGAIDHVASGAFAIDWTAQQLDDFVDDNPNFAEGFKFAANTAIVRSGTKAATSTAKHTPQYRAKVTAFAKSEQGSVPAPKAVRGSKKSDREIIKGTVSISKSKYPETASHIEDVINQGKPTVLTIDRKGAYQRRKEALNNIKPKVGYDRDEYPPAMFKEGGKNSSVRHISPSDNRGAGSCIGHQCKQYSDGDKVKLEIKE